MSKIFTTLCLLLFVFVFTTSTAKADPIVVTSGSLTVTGVTGSPSYNFAGTNFTATGSGGDEGNTGPAGCSPCVSGSLINVNSFFVGTSLGHGNVTIDSSVFNNIFIAGEFGFSVAAVLVPVSLTDVTLMAPFTFGGTMIGCVEPHLICQTQVFTVQVIGSGTATIQLQHFLDSAGNSLFSFRSVTYTFETAAVPEPASMLILMGGLAALGAKKLRFIRSAGPRS